MRLATLGSISARVVLSRAVEGGDPLVDYMYYTIINSMRFSRTLSLPFLGGHRSHGVSFYLVPHFQENAFHLHNDNIMPMTASILSTPCLCSGEELESCTQLRKVRLDVDLPLG